MKLTVGKMIAIWVTCMVLGFSMTSVAKAACDPDECGNGCDDTEQCSAKCCVPKGDGGGGGGGGFIGRSCGNTTVGTPQLTCVDNSQGFSTTFRGTCNAQFPSYMSSTGQYCYTGCTCCATGQVLNCTPGTNYTHKTLVPGTCLNRFDQAISYVLNPNFNSSTDCYISGYSDGEKNAGDPIWKCKRYLTTCMPRTCACAPSCVTAAPTTPTLNSPGAGDSLPGTSATLLWNGFGAATDWGKACTNTTKTWRVYADTNPTPTTLRTTVADGSSLSYSFTGLNPGTTYYWRVEAHNGDLGTYSVTRSFNMLTSNTVSGTVYNDVNNICSTSVPMTGVTVSIGGVPVTVDGAGRFSRTSMINGSYTVAVNVPATHSCSTGVGCNVCSKSVTLPSGLATNMNFYLSSLRTSWWQVEGAGIYSAGEVRSTLPNLSSRLIVEGTSGTVGALLSGSGTNSFGAGSVSDPGWVAKTKYTGKKMGYDYFGAHMGLVKGETEMWSGGLEQDNCDPTDDFCYGPAATTGSWHVTSGQKYTVFVDGDLRVGNDVVVDQGGFLAFIVNGDVVVDPAVTQMQGLYVMDGDFMTEAGNLPLEVEGSVIAWGTFSSMMRDLGNSNSLTPAEKFSYRQDLLTNMPEEMKSFAMQWQEVVAGTFKN